jgi:hypothetical protein
MSRSLRVLVADGWYHVTARRDECRAIFRGGWDHVRLLECIVEMTQRYGMWIAVYALMGRPAGGSGWRSTTLVKTYKFRCDPMRPMPI